MRLGAASSLARDQRKQVRGGVACDQREHSSGLGVHRFGLRHIVIHEIREGVGRR